MSLCRPTDTELDGPSGAPSLRAFSLVEAIVSQTIAFIVIAGLLSIMASQTNVFRAEEGSVGGRIRLREASHVLLRDSQGVGGEDGNAGSLLTVTEGGTALDNWNGSDTLEIFRRDRTICGGELGLEQPTTSLTLGWVIVTALDGSCPIASTGGCTPAQLVNARASVTGESTVVLHITEVDIDGGDCRVRFNSSHAFNSGRVALFNQQFTFSPAAASSNDVLDLIDDVDDGQLTAGTIYPGRTLSYRVSNDVLQRSINGGTYEDIIDRVYDLQVVRGYDIDGDGEVAASEWWTTAMIPSGATAANFLGFKIGLLVYGPSNGLEVRPPGSLGNRIYPTSGGGMPPTGRRYQGSYVFAAVRNR